MYLVGFLALAIVATLWCSDCKDRPTYNHKSIEMKATNGRLTYFRQTTSEKEI